MEKELDVEKEEAAERLLDACLADRFAINLLCTVWRDRRAVSNVRAQNGRAKPTRVARALLLCLDLLELGEAPICRGANFRSYFQRACARSRVLDRLRGGQSLGWLVGWLVGRFVGW